MKIKICGLKTLEAIAEINRQNVDFAGFIAYKKSARFVNAQTYKLLAESVNAKSVLVTVDANEEIIAEYVAAFKPDFLQLHGNETSEIAEQLKQKHDVKIIKAIAANENMALEIDRFHNVADMLLFDTQTTDGTFGGTGEAFDWRKIATQQINIPWFLSGGIGAHNIAEAAKIATNIDVSSHLETQKGIKDVAKIAQFMDIVKKIGMQI